MNFATWFASWHKQPSTIIGFGLVVGAVAYWFSKSTELSLLAAGVVCGVVDDHTKELLASIEGIEDNMRKVQASTTATATATAAMSTRVRAGFSVDPPGERAVPRA